MGWKRDEILRMAASNPDRTISKREINEALSGYYYFNGDKHLGNIVSRLVSSGHLIRIKRGVYKLADKASVNSSSKPVNKNQLNLFK